MTRCKQEMCPNWSGDGDVCPCALFDIEPPPDHERGEFVNGLGWSCVPCDTFYCEVVQ